MAISFARLTIHTRSKGHSAVAASAYRAGISLYEERTGSTFSFDKRHDVLSSEILLPDGASELFLDRSTLWNQVELAEKRKDAQLAKELTLALPKEISLEHQKALAKKFAVDQFVNHGLAVDCAIHDKNDGNPHAHLLITTRRVEGDRLSSKKARDLNPVFYGVNNKKVYDIWHERWRDAQNSYFQENKIDLSVDDNFLFATKHEGRQRSKHAHYLKNENKDLKELSYKTLLESPLSVIEQISNRHSTFRKKDIASVVFKNTASTEDFNIVMTKIMSSNQLVELGPDLNGEIRFTTKSIYQQEQKMISQSISMTGGKGKTTSYKSANKTAREFKLSDEQSSALSYIANTGDIACLVGRAGAGKTYTMKAVKQLYSKTGINVYGTALSGIAAKTLEQETGIKSDTIYSLTKRIREGRYLPKPGSVIVVDEAGMVSLSDMAKLVEYAKISKSKLILLGDQDQLQPINAGAPFRAILEHVGFVELSNIRRQQNEQDRNASLNLSQGKIGKALDHYSSSGSLSISNSPEVELIDKWASQIDSSVSNSLILAHTRKQVATLNKLARQRLISDGLLANKNEVSVLTNTGEILLSSGDKILFLKNSRSLGVCNGDFGTIENIKGDTITALVNGSSVSFSLKDYKDFSYGYAATVHKSQGATYQHVYTLLQGYGWDKHLSYVAFTRHKDSLSIHADANDYSDVVKLKKQLSRSPTRDNAIDYPLSFSQRRGFNPDSQISKAIDYIEGLKNSIKDKWLYIRNHEQWVKQQQSNNRLADLAHSRKFAAAYASFYDLDRHVREKWNNAYAQGGLQNKELLDLTALRDKKGYEIQNYLNENPNTCAKGQLDSKHLQKCAHEYEKFALLESSGWDELKKIEGRYAKELCESILKLRDQALKNRNNPRRSSQITERIINRLNTLASSQHVSGQTAGLTNNLMLKTEQYRSKYILEAHLSRER